MALGWNHSKEMVPWMCLCLYLFELVNDKKTKFLQFSFGGGTRVVWSTLFHLSLWECHCGWPLINHLPFSDPVHPSGTCWIGTKIKGGLLNRKWEGWNCIVNSPWWFLKQEPALMVGCKLPGGEWVHFSFLCMVAEKDASQSEPKWGMDTEVFAGDPALPANPA